MVAPGASALGDYLREGREQVRPEDVGLTAGARRRWPASAPPTTCDSSRTPIPPLKLWRRSRELFSSTLKRRNICTSWRRRPAAVGLLDPAARELYVDWDPATEIAVSGLREVAGIDMGDPRLRALIEELSAASPRFRELWARADVGYRAGVIHMRHPEVGDLHLHSNRLSVTHSRGQHLLIYHAEPGSQSAKALEQLRFLATSLL